MKAVGFLGLLMLSLMFFTGCDQVHPARQITTITDQPDLVPPAMLREIQVRYPNAQNIKASILEVNALWYITFENNSAQMAVVSDASGYFLATERAISQTTLPSVVLSYLKTHYASYSLSNVAQILDGTNIIGYKMNVAANVTTTLYFWGVDANSSSNASELLPSSVTKVQIQEQNAISFSLKEKDVPAGIQTYLAQQTGNYLYRGGIVTFSNGSKFYQISVMVQGKLMTVQFDSNLHPI